MSRFARSLARPVRFFAALTGLVAASACSHDATSILAPVSHGGDSVAAAPPPTHTDSGASSLLSLIGSTLWVDPSSSARSTADAWRTTRPADAAQMDKLANAPSARWIGNWNTNVQADVNTASATMATSGAIPVFVAYNIPQRDCGGYSGGNVTAPAAYKTWIDAFASGLGNRRAVIVLEPDALAGMDCLSPADQQMRLDLLSYAVRQFTAKNGVAVYIDAGNPRWQSAAVMADRLKSAGVGRAQGFSLNVSNFYLTSDNVSYGTDVANRIGGKHFIVDTGRNGLGPTADAQWCNPDGRALGNLPTTAT
ncbi:MAG TPA: glycoside hydrolase family 6 protein, partial [Gemmatimonadaceae bacterium]